MKNIIFHVDVNSAFLSWEALRRIQNGDATDLRDIPSVIGGDEKKRHGIVLAKSTSAKKYGIITGEPLVKARQKCPDLTVAAPHFDYFVQCSKNLMKLLAEYAPVVEQYSIDEAFCDMSGTESLYGDLIALAQKLKDTIFKQLGFTVNVGISENRLLAKMASDFEKPDRVHTLFVDEIPQKLWPLPVQDLFFVGHSTADKLHQLGIHTIGALAQTDPGILRYHFKKHGEIIHSYANGQDVMSIVSTHHADAKSYGNEVTLSQDVCDYDTACHIMLSLCETIGARIRADKAYIRVVCVHVTDTNFHRSSRQVTLDGSTNVTEIIYTTACHLFKSFWDQTPLRLIGVSTGKATTENYEQYDLFQQKEKERLGKLNSAIDSIRDRFGEDSIKRACFTTPKRND